MTKHSIKKDWNTKAGYKAVILKLDIGELPDGTLLQRYHHCGYVGIPKNHPLYGKCYSEHCECLEKLFKKALKEEIGDKGIISCLCSDGKTANMDVTFRVHGSVTYSRTSPDYPIKSDLHWIGFDCAHLDDTIEKCDLDFCIKECEELAKQLKSIEKEQDDE